MVRILILVLLDLIAIPVLFLISYTVKFKAGLFYNIIFNTNTGLIYNHAQVEPYFDNMGIIIMIWMISLVSMQAYKPYSGILGFVDQVINIIKAVLLATILLMAISQIMILIPNSLFVLGYNAIFGTILFSMSRLFVDKLVKVKPFKPAKCCILGSNKEAQYILEFIVYQQQLYYEYMGSIYKNEPSELLFSIQNKHKKVASLDQMEDYLIANKIKHLFVIKAECPEIKTLIKFCETYKISLHIYDDDMQAIKHRSQYNQIADLPILSYKIQKEDSCKKLLKRLVDCVVAYSLLLILSPCLIVISIWIKLVSPKGSFIFRQERVGLKGKIFTMYKFRTMKLDAEKESGPVWVKEDDNRYIVGGRLLRKFSLDELPQLINIIKNDMSIIGPRPERPFFVDKISQDIPEFTLRHEIKGGVTGWAQIHGRAYLTTRPAEKLRYDLFYLKNQSFILDFKILLKTILVVGKGEQAY